MKFAVHLSSSETGFLAALVVAVATASATAIAGPQTAAIDVAASGQALEIILEKHPGARDEVANRAVALGLAVVEVSLGPPSDRRTELRVAGGGRPFADCAPQAGCPPMVAIPATASGFKIGSPPSEPDRLASEDQVEVSIPAFAMATRPVTVAEYKACVADGGCRPPEWLEPDGQHNIETGTSRYYANLGEHLTGDAQPVVGVSQRDGVAFAAWLSKKTGQTYRLPSEAEWERAARAGTTTAYWWGDEAPDGNVRAVCTDCGTEWDSKALAPAQSFDPNPWGLYNVHGNVWEWTADLFCDDYATGPRDGRARATDDCKPQGDRPAARGVYSMRGGSAFFPAKSMRSATRLRQLPDFRNVSVGFRVARDLAP